MIRHRYPALALALMVTSAWAFAQEATETSPSISVSTPVIQTLPSSAASGSQADSAGPKLPPLDQLEKMSPDELIAAIGGKSSSDLSGMTRRSMKQVGVLSTEEGGLPSGSLVQQNSLLIRTVLEKNSGQLVSRWGHILLRRALASRLDSPNGMLPSEFAALRAALLLRMGEADAARALIQDVDPGNYGPELSNVAMDAYIATGDFTGLCPILSVQGNNSRKEPTWVLTQSICEAFRGNGNAAMSKLDAALNRRTAPRIDVLLAQKYAGAAGKARRAVKIEWDGVTDMTQWRYAMTMAVGLRPPENLMAKAGKKYDLMTATAPMAGLSDRAASADHAAQVGVLSGAAMVDLYGQLYGDADTGKELKAQTDLLRDAFVAPRNVAKYEAMDKLWGGAKQDLRYGRQVLTASAAARMPVDPALKNQAGALVTSMLASGYDANALRWQSIVEQGSLAWGLLALASPNEQTTISLDGLKSFESDDDSENSRKSAFLLAGLAGLGRVSSDDAASFADRLDVQLDGASRWASMIDAAAQADNAALVALLAGLGMQGSDWDKMTPKYLYHMVSALNRVGLETEARMIAAEAVARG